MPLAVFEPLARVAGVRLFSLHKGFGIEQLADVRGPFRSDRPGKPVGSDRRGGGDAIARPGDRSGYRGRRTWPGRSAFRSGSPFRLSRTGAGWWNEPIARGIPRCACSARKHGGTGTKSSSGWQPRCGKWSISARPIPRPRGHPDHAGECRSRFLPARLIPGDERVNRRFGDHPADHVKARSPWL